jgi:Spy/CpxP family protein refolding chaperone
MTSMAAFLRSRWPAALLVASLVLNGFLIGMWAVDAFRTHHRHDGPRAANFELRRLADRLPREAIDQIAAELKPLDAGMKAHFERMRGIREEINRLAASPNPDRAAIDQKLTDIRAEAAALQEEMQKATYDALLKLPPETRAPLANPARS